MKISGDIALSNAFRTKSLSYLLPCGIWNIENNTIINEYAMDSFAMSEWKIIHFLLTVTWYHPAPFSTRPLALFRADPGIGELRRRNVLALFGSNSTIRSSSSSIWDRRPCSKFPRFKLNLLALTTPVLKLTRRFPPLFVLRIVISDGVRSRSSCSETNSNG